MEHFMDERIEVCRVRIRRDSTRQAAIVSDLLAAERLVAEWSKARPAQGVVEWHLRQSSGKPAAT